MARPFEEHVAWITGAGTGIGKALAVEIAKQGAAVAVSGRRKDRLDEVVKAIEDAGGRAIGVVCDVTQEPDVARAAKQVVSTFGRIDVAIANAGFSVAGRVESLSADDWRRQLETNVVGAAMTAKYALPSLRETKGRLALVGSVSAFIPTPRMGAYTASKYALRAIGQTLAMELAGSGVSCTLLHPGFVESEIAQVDNAGTHDPSREDKRPKNLMWPADRAAKTMLRAVRSRKLEHVFTGHGKIGAALGQHAPGLAHFLMTRTSVQGRAEKNLKSGS
jgi:NAD(P)-dependent dehydrogenase (short-subunit alcohol dehydrogenase family)